jgi:hypothetical protein
MKTAIFYSFVILVCSGLPTAAEEEDTGRNLEIDSTFATGAHWSIQDGAGILQIRLPAIKDDLPLPKPPSIRIWLLQPDGSSTKPSTKGDSPMGISMRGFTTPSLIYEFPPRAASTAVAVVVQVEGEFFVLSLIPEKKLEEQEGADPPATAPESKPEGSSKP